MTTAAEIVPLHLSDHEIVRGVVAGEPRAQRELVRRYGRLMASVLLNTLGPRSDVDDLLQEAYMVAFRDAHKLREPGALKSWLVSVAASRARNCLRAERRRWWLSFREPENVPEIATSPADDEAVRAVYEALSQMKPGTRVLFSLRYIQGLSVGEIASAIGVSESTARRRVASARARFDRLVAGDSRVDPWLGEVSDESR